MRPTSTPTAREVHDLGDAVGRIAGIAARSLHESFPNLDLERLVETFTRDSAIEFIGRRYLAAIEQGKTTAEAAGDAGTALIRAWSAARLEARVLIDSQKTATA
ncbi:hypothetical protein [Streptomyces cinereoruber]|uniref:hypothetical protein n=1 Tax=Streptomyces cinereoruber TaxID=67260 RepID=UPI00362595C3